jgi:hypothetical protein
MVQTSADFDFDGRPRGHRLGQARIALHSEDAATRLDSISLERPDTVTT